MSPTDDVLRIGDIRVYTYKTGLLSRVAHDLQLTLGRWELRRSGDQLEGVFWPDSLRVDGAMKNGRLDPRTLSQKDRETIAQTIQKEILHTGRHGQIKLVATVSGDDASPRITGTLDIMGKQQPVDLEARVTYGRLELETELAPTRWGIPPYKAMMGAIKLQDRVRVRASIQGWGDPDA